MTGACSLIISTYNWPSALQLCLKSVLRQSVLPAEIIIADDGSTTATRALIDKVAAESPVPIIHVWQRDEGFQLAKIRNRAIAKAAQPYIIQIDGDLILHQHFIKDHLHIQEPNYFVSGSRVLLSPATSQALLHNNSLELEKHARGTKNIFNKLRNGFLRKFLGRRYKIRGKNKFYVKGCNMAFWRNDLLTVNGYNEAFTGWGKEDSELAIRLINAGIKKKFLKLGGITYHLYHKEASRQMEQRNLEIMEVTIKNKCIVAAQGLNQYLHC